MLVLLMLVGCHFPYKPWVLVEITNVSDGQQVLLNQEMYFSVLARSSQGIAKIEMYLNGELESIESPPIGHPREFNTGFSVHPQIAGNTIVSVVAVDHKGTVSKPFNISLEVVTTIEEIDQQTTPTPTLSIEEIAGTQTAQANCTNDALFVEHVTIPENTKISANTNFTKIWRVKNTGSCDWSGYQIVHVSGNILGARSPRVLPVINAGSNADLVIDMVAPASPGTHMGIWRIQAGDGALFGPDLIINIIVPELPTNTPVPTATPTQTPSPTPIPTQTFTPTPLAINVQQISEQISIPANTTENKTIVCPAGSVVVSGGYSHQADIRVWQSMKSENGWHITATNSHTGPRNLTITATCLFNSNGTSNSVYEEKSAVPNGLTQISVNCPSGSLVTGGGWSIENNLGLIVFQSTKSGNGWQVDLYNPTDKSPDITVYAICLNGVSGSTFQNESIKNKVPPNSTASAQKDCPMGSFVTGGGYAIDKELTLFHTTKEGNGWINYVTNPTSVEKRLDTFVICYQP
jgi:hypothetical protein